MSEIYHGDRTHLDKQRGEYLMSDLVNQALDYYAIVEPSVASYKQLNDPFYQTDRFQNLCIRDFHNFF